MKRLGGRLVATARSVAFSAERGGTSGLSWVARRRGQTPAVLPYVGYAGPDAARVLARVVLSPPSVEPAAARGVSGWRRLLTLEQPGVDVEVELGGVRRTATSDGAGLIDVTLEVGLPPGREMARLIVGERAAQDAIVLVSSAEARTGVVCDVDDTAWVTGLRHPLRAARRTLGGSSADREAVPGMADLLTSVVEGRQHPPVVYLSNGPWNLAGPVARFLDRSGFPAGALLMTDWGLRPDHWFRDGKAHKKGSLERLAKDFPWVRWVLVGDDGELTTPTSTPPSPAPTRTRPQPSPYGRSVPTGPTARPRRPREGTWSGWVRFLSCAPRTVVSSSSGSVRYGQPAEMAAQLAGTRPESWVPGPAARCRQPELGAVRLAA